jgi:uncharacterized membrane protein
MSDASRIQGPAARYAHDHPPVRNVNEVQASRRSTGQRIADRVAAAVGSWPFIITQSLVLVLWLAMNVYLASMVRAHPGFLKSWDPYPFILLNLVLSFQAAYTGPIVMMSQNRQADKDRLMAQSDYECNLKAEQEIKVIMEHLDHQDQMSAEVLQRLAALEAAIQRAIAGFASGAGQRPDA